MNEPSIKKPTIFQIFKIGQKERKKTYFPSSKKEWIIDLISEFIGTFLISMALAGLCIFLPNNKKILNYFGHQLLVGMYGMLVMVILLIIFLRWSCDINPAITIFKIINGSNSCKYGFSKIIIQFMGGIVAGILLYFLTHQHYIQIAIDATRNQPWIFRLGYLSKPSLPKLTKISAFFWELFVESFITLLLLWSIFSKALTEKYRNIVVVFAFGCAIVGGMISGNSWAVNPARGLAQQIPAILNGNIMNGGILATTIALLLSGIVAPILYALIQGFVIRFGNHAFLSIVLWKIPTIKNKKKGSKK